MTVTVVRTGAVVDGIPGVMLPPVADVYVVWHPGDRAGAAIAQTIVDHFHGTPFTGLIGGAVEIYPRSVGWRSHTDAPRPIPLPGLALSNGIPSAELVALVPVLGSELAHAFEYETGPWYDYAMSLVTAHAASQRQVGIFPVVLDRAAEDGTRVDRVLGRFHRIGPTPADPSSSGGMRQSCRDLAQGLTQLANGGVDRRLTVMISHTRSGYDVDRTAVAELTSVVRWIIGQTHLNEFFDAHDLQSGDDWRQALRAAAATSALLVLRTDRYSSQAWCQREMLHAKRAGMPVVILDSLQHADERGSFLMDHVPRVRVRRTDGGWRVSGIHRGLNLLVDECLKRSLWRHQQRLAASVSEPPISWWAPHAPEPVTLAAWLADQWDAGQRHAGWPIRILHPDPPLGPDEVEVLEQMAGHAGAGGLEIMTPRSLAARGGSTAARVTTVESTRGGRYMTDLLPRDALRGTRVAVSASESPDLGRLGLLESHFRLALGEITRTVLALGGELIYGGDLRPHGYTAFMLTELHRYGRRDRPLLACLAWSEHRKLSLTELRRFTDELGLLGRLVCLDPTGAEVDPAEGRGEAPVPADDPELRREGLTSLRRYMRDLQAARVLIGGKRQHSEPKLPGLMEEALLTLEAAHPIYLAGGFGGATLDIARALGVDDGSWLPPAGPPPGGAGFDEGYARLAALAHAPGWRGLANGLSGEENRRLAVTHRPSDIATLVGLGLGRCATGRAAG